MKKLRLVVAIMSILFCGGAYADTTVGTDSNANAVVVGGPQSMTLNQNSNSSTKVPVGFPIPANIQLPTTPTFIQSPSPDQLFLRYSKLFAKFTRGAVSGNAYKDGRMMPKMEKLGEFVTVFQPLGNFRQMDSDVAPDFSQEVYSAEDLVNLPKGTKHIVLGQMGVTVDKDSDFTNAIFIQSVLAVANTQVVESGVLNGQGTVVPVFIIDTLAVGQGTLAGSETLTVGVSAGMPAGGGSGGINIGWGTNDNRSTQQFTVIGRVVYLKQDPSGKPIVDTLRAQKAADEYAQVQAQAQAQAVAAQKAQQEQQAPAYAIAIKAIGAK